MASYQTNVVVVAAKRGLKVEVVPVTLELLSYTKVTIQVS